MTKKLLVLSTATAAVAAALFLAPAAASAATITPNILTDELNAANANCSLREALSIANTNLTTAEPDCPVTNGGLGTDTISLGAGSYVLDVAGAGNDTNATGDLDVIATGGDLTIDGLAAGTTTIDTDDAPVWADRVLHQVAGTGTTQLVVRDLTVSGGNAGNDDDGGGIRSDAGTLVVQGARVTRNTGESGAGVSAGGPVSILDSLINVNTNNVNVGGGVGISGGVSPIDATIDSSVIKGNITTAGSGAGIFAAAANLTVTDSVIAGNDAGETSEPVHGGGIEVTAGFTAPSVTIRGTTISGNEVLGGTTREGGGVYVDSGAVTLVNSTVSDNKAELAGGSAGGVVVDGGTLNLVQTTVGPNPSGGGPGALSQTGGTLNVRGSVIESPVGILACGGTIASGGFNVFTDASCGTLTSGDEANADPQLGALAANDGLLAGRPDSPEPILTQLPAQTSTAVDHVPAASCDDEIGGPPLLLVDQRGLGRPFNGDGSGAADCDAGSVELQTAPPPPTPPATGGGQPAAQGPAAVPAATKKKCKKAKKGAVAAKKKCKKKK
jgi:hypothetical protein